MTGPFPYPRPPERPPPTVPGLPIGDDHPRADPYQLLFARRTVVLRGRLDAEAATRLAAELMALDAPSGRDVELLINSPGGPLGDVFPVLDVIQLMRARVNTTCIGQALGTAAAVLASGTGTRRAAPNATISLRCAERESLAGEADALQRDAAHLEQQRLRLVALLAAKTGQRHDTLRHDLSHAAPLTTPEAISYGLIDQQAAAR